MNTSKPFTKRYLTKTYVISLAVLIIALLLLSTCNRSTSNKPVYKQVDKVRLGLTKTPPGWLTLIAKAKGFYKKHALDADILFFKSGKRALKGMFAGKVDVAITADGPIVFQSMKRKDFTVVATIGSSSNDNVVVASRQSGILKPADLKGKRIATQKKSSAHFYQHLFLIENGLSEADVTRVFMKVEKLPEALKNGQTDAISTREPFYSETLKLLGENAIAFETPGLYFKTFQLVTSENYIAKKQRVLEKITRALIDAEQFLLENHNESVEVLSKEVGISKASIEKVLASLHLAVRLEQSLILNLEDEARWVVNSKLSNGAVVPNYLDFISEDTLLKIRPESVTITH